MDHKILNSAVKITQQRDLESLEFSLVLALAELIPISGISIIKFEAENKLESAEEVVSLTLVENTNHANRQQWSTDSKGVVVDAQQQQCLQSKSAVYDQCHYNSKRLIIPILNDNKAIGIVNLYVTEDITSYQFIAEGIVKLFENCFLILYESERDMLTGLLNRRTFDKKLNRLLETQLAKKTKYINANCSKERRQIESESNAWLVIADIDHFKHVNDNYGHVFGDEVILNVSQIMQECFRSSDLLFRFGGEEFVIILEPIQKNQAQQTLDRFRETIAEYHFPQISNITISIGFARITECDYPPFILERADQALYYAKEHGRNKVCNYEHLVREGKLRESSKISSIDLF